MAWPAGGIDTSNLDASSDSPDSARADLLAAVQQLNDVISMRGVAGGVASLNAQGKIPSTELSASTLLQLIATVDGSGSLLDADKLDGKDSTDYVLVDGSQDVIRTTTPPFRVRANLSLAGSALTAIHSGFGVSVQQSAAGAVGDGFGGQFLMGLDDDGGTARSIAALNWVWGDVSAENAYVDLQVMNAGSTLPNGAKFRFTNENAIELKQTTTPAATPPAGRWAFYFTSAGFTIHDGSSETVLGSGSVTDHGSLTGLADQSDHTWAVTLDGTRVMTGDFQLGAFGGLFTDLGADHAAPASGKVIVYTKSQGLYYRKADGTVIGPLDTGGGASDHGALTGLADDDHPQYALLQPTAAITTWNDSGADRDLIFEGVGFSRLLVLDAGTGTVSVNVTTPAASKRLQVNATGTDAAIYATTVNGTGVEAIASGTGIGGRFQSLDGQGLVVYRAGSSSDFLADLVDDSTGTGGVMLLQAGNAGRTIVDMRDDNAASTFIVGTSSAYFNNAKVAGKQFIARGGTGFDDLLQVDSTDNVVRMNTASSNIGLLNIKGKANQTASLYVVGATGETSTVLIAPLAGVGLRVASGVSGGTAAQIESLDGNTLYLKKSTTSSGVRTGVLVADCFAGSAPVLGVFNQGTGDHLTGFRNAAGTDVAVRLMKDGTYEAREQSSVGAAASGFWRLYFKTDGAYIRSTGAEVKLTAGVGATPGAPDRSVQVNVSGAFTGNGNLLFTAANDLEVIGGVDITRTAGDGLEINTSSTAVGVDLNHSGTGRAVDITSTGSAEALYVNRNDSAGAVPLAVFHEDHASSGNAAVQIRNDGLGSILECLDGATEVFSVRDGGTVHIEGLGSAPSGALGDLYVDTSDNKLYFHNNSGWVSCIEAGGGAPGGSAAGEIQFWTSGPAFAASSDFVWDNTAKDLNITGDSRVSDDAYSSGLVLAIAPLTSTYTAAAQTLAILGTTDVAKMIGTTDNTDGFVRVTSGGYFGLTGTTDADGSLSVKLVRAAAGVLGVQDGSSVDAGVNCLYVKATDYLKSDITETSATPSTPYTGWFDATWNPSASVTADYNSLWVSFTAAGGASNNFTPPDRLAAINARFLGNNASGSIISEGQAINVDLRMTGAGTLTLGSGIRIKATRVVGGTFAEARGIFLEASSGTIGTESPIYSEWAATSYFLGALQTDATFQLNGSISGTVSIGVGSSPSTYTFTLPDSAGSSGQVLQTDGAGVTSWATQTLAHGSTNGLIQLTDGSGNFTSFANFGLLTGVMTSAFPFLIDQTLAGGADTLALRIKANASQTEDLLRITDSADAVLFAIEDDGKIETNQAVANTNTPSGATSAAWPVYDEFGVLKGYVPMYASQW